MRMHYLINVLPPEKLPPMENMIFLFDLNKFITSTKCPDVCTPDIIKNHLKDDALNRDSCSEWRNVVKDQTELEGRIYVSYLTRGSNYTCLPSNDMKTTYRELWGNNVSDKVMTYNSKWFKQELVKENSKYLLSQVARFSLLDRGEREPTSENTNQKQDSSEKKKNGGREKNK
jgi:hypothetical protein